MGKSLGSKEKADTKNVEAVRGVVGVDVEGEKERDVRGGRGGSSLSSLIDLARDGNGTDMGRGRWEWRRVVMHRNKTTKQNSKRRNVMVHDAGHGDETCISCHVGGHV